MYKISGISVNMWLKTPYQPLSYTDCTDWMLSVCHTLLEHSLTINDYHLSRCFVSQHRFTSSSKSSVVIICKGAMYVYLSIPEWKCGNGSLISSVTVNPNFIGLIIYLSARHRFCRVLPVSWKCNEPMMNADSSIRHICVIFMDIWPLTSIAPGHGH